jgi:hypothetical protein
VCIDWLIDSKLFEFLTILHLWTILTENLGRVICLRNKNSYVALYVRTMLVRIERYVKYWWIIGRFLHLFIVVVCVGGYRSCLDRENIQSCVNS